MPASRSNDVEGADHFADVGFARAAREQIAGQHENRRARIVGRAHGLDRGRGRAVVEQPLGDDRVECLTLQRIDEGGQAVERRRREALALEIAAQLGRADAIGIDDRDDELVAFRTARIDFDLVHVVRVLVQHAGVAQHAPAAVLLVRDEFGARAGFERRTDPCGARDLGDTGIENRVLRARADHAGVERLGAEQLGGRFAVRFGDFLDLRKCPRAAAAQLAVAL